MDFTELKNKLKTATAPLLEKAGPLLEGVKNAGYKALDFTQKQLQNTPLIIKTHDEYIEMLTKKRAILISYDETDPIAREILMRSPLWGARAFADVAELKLAELSRSSELMSEIGVTTPIDMRVWYIGERTFHSTDLAEIIKWWEMRCYDGKTVDNGQGKMENENSEIDIKINGKLENAPVDPLAGK